MARIVLFLVNMSQVPPTVDFTLPSEVSLSILASSGMIFQELRYVNIDIILLMYA